MKTCSFFSHRFISFVLVVIIGLNFVSGDPLKRLPPSKPDSGCPRLSECIPFERCKYSCDTIFQATQIQRLLYYVRDKCTGPTGDKRLYVCCEDKYVLDFAYCSEHDDSKELEHAKSAQRKLNQAFPGCGKTPELDFTLFVLNGEPAHKDHNQWSGVLFGNTICSVVLLTKKHIVSAAHCFDKSDKYYVAFSLDAKISSVDKCLPSSECMSGGCYDELENQKCISYDIIEVIKHPKYDEKELPHNFDIAIMTLEQEVELNPICLPDLDTFEDLGLFEEVTVSAWSNDKAHQSSANIKTYELIQGDFSHVPNERCSKKFEVDSVSVLHMCMETIGTVETRAYVCKGDSGAGAVRDKGNGQVELVGLTNSGLNDCTESQYSIFTRLSGPILRWVLNQLYEHDIR